MMLEKIYVFTSTYIFDLRLDIIALFFIYEQLPQFNMAKRFKDHILFSPVIFDRLYWKRALKLVFFFFLTFCFINTRLLIL